MERNESSSIIKIRPSSLHRSLLQLYHHTILCSDIHVGNFIPYAFPISFILRKYLPRLIPVEVPESKAREWCRSLVSAIDFLHKRGVVHNDIKSVTMLFFGNFHSYSPLTSRPANILLTSAVPPVPVLVDFGFAEKYDTSSKKAFISNLAYGTPEVIHVLHTAICSNAI